jgi:hypothetical protein
MQPIMAIRVSAAIAIAICVAAALGISAWLARRPSTRPPAPPVAAVIVPPPVAAVIVPPPAATPAPAPARPQVPLRLEPPRCCGCAMKDNRKSARRNHRVITARYLGVRARYDEDGERTTARCRPGHRVWASVQFALVGPSPFDNPDATPAELAHMSMSLPCPELSRAAYIKRFGNDPSGYGDDDGLGSAPVLQRGTAYRLTVVANPDIDELADELVWTLLTVDPQ